MTGSANVQADSSGGVGEWIWRTRAITRARAAGAEALSAVQRARFARAKGLMADAAGGAGPAARVAILREATYWALRAHDDAPGETSLDDALVRAGTTLVSWASGGDDRKVSQVLRGGFERTMSRNHEELLADATRLEAFAGSLLSRLEGRSPAVDHFLLQRGWRSAILVVTALLVAVGASYGFELATRKPNVALGKAWRSSSSWGGAPMAGRTDVPHPGQPLFITNLEANPWFDVDLGAPLTVSRVDLQNRKDCCKERAVPLVIETSLDRRKWEEVAKQDTPFTSQKLTFPPRAARYVRVRATRSTYLHLDSVVVR